MTGMRSHRSDSGISAQMVARRFGLPYAGEGGLRALSARQMETPVGEDADLHLTAGKVRRSVPRTPMRPPGCQCPTCWRGYPHWRPVTGQAWQ